MSAEQPFIQTAPDPSLPSCVCGIPKNLAATLFGLQTDGVIITDTNGKITYCNHAAETLLGLARGTGAGLDITQSYITLFEQGRMPCENACVKVLVSRQAVQNKRLLICFSGSGSERLVLESAAPLFDGSDQFCGTILVVRDFTDMIDQIRVSDKMESFKTLSGGLANDFNNLLTVITNSLFLARLDLKSDCDKSRILLHAEQAAFQATMLTKQLLSIAGGGQPVLTEVDLKQLISSLAGFVVDNDRIEYDIKCDDDLVNVSADRGMIDQAIGNVLKNAVQAMPDGGELHVRAVNVTVDASLPLPLTEGDYVCVTISDSGAGIPQEHKTKVFDPFFTTRPDGHGLGLSFTYSVIRQHGGHVTVDSGKSGTTVSIYLPRLKSRGAPKPEKGMGSGRILFMDDDKLLRHSAGRILSYLGFEVTFACTGDEAVAAYQNSLDTAKTFDIVILDLLVEGGKGGNDAVGEILAIDPGACVVISSGYVSDPVVVDFAKYGFSGAITKPYNISEMSQTLLQLTQRKR
jgi:two-component system cell cycle sensor histidine kinase/response regulator CckA